MTIGELQARLDLNGELSAVVTPGTVIRSVVWCLFCVVVFSLFCDMIMGKKVDRDLKEGISVTKGTNQKLKMLYLKQIFEEETDDQHSLTLQNITERLNSLGVNADRKTLNQDFKELKRYGMDIIAMQEGRTWNYHLGSRDFELPEVKLLVDSVQASKFINEHKSDTHIRKHEKLVSH